jgi:8-oxo-dGTP pyrophosphatase MutT (NUDIX family)
MTIWVNQSGVIPILDGRLCMVTSRNRRRWVFPKGVIEQGHTPRESGLMEAWEEAGLVGTLDPEPVGNYVYEKFGHPHHVLVYLMRVIEAHDSWPEHDLRDRAWLTVADAVERTEEPGLQELLRRTFEVGHTDRLGLAAV